MRKTAPIVALAGLAAIIASPAAAQDRRVPANAGGNLAEFAGQEWVEPLAYCTAVWSRARSLAETPADRAMYLTRGVAFRHRAVVRLMTDRRLDTDRASAAFDARREVRFFMLRGQDLQTILARGPGCADILERYDAANP